MEQARNFIKAEKVGRVATITIDHPPTNSKAQEIANGIARMRTKSIRGIMGAMHVPYRIGLAEGKATEHENYMEIYDPKTFVAAVTALFEQRTIEFTD